MPTVVQHDADLAALNSFGVPARAAHYARISDTDELQQALDFAAEQRLPLLVLGGGSNTLFLGNYHGLVLHVANRGIQWSDDSRRVTVAAGENWHDFVSLSIERGFYGLENLALIPGLVGAAPIQNIGAYGRELADVFVELEAIDLQTGKHHTLDKAACEFGYRDSLFKSDPETQWLIWSVTLQLQAKDQPDTSYAALRKVLAEQGDAQVSAKAVFATVCAIRRSKLPDPAELGNAGSFFKNPLVSADKLAALQAEHADVPHFATDSAKLVKLPAAWLIEQAGWKGKRRGQAGVHEQHALVIVNHGHATGEEIFLLAQEISASVLNKFGVALQPEVRLIHG